jgi:toxin ParE1/3/4
VNHVFHPDAALEFEEAVRFYRARGRTLGDRFAVEVRATIRKILETPARWRVLEGDVRLCLVRIFPYSMLYTVERDYVLIIAIRHGKREPGYWRHRLKSKPTA